MSVGSRARVAVGGSTFVRDDDVRANDRQKAGILGLSDAGHVR